MKKLFFTITLVTLVFIFESCSITKEQRAARKQMQNPKNTVFRGR